MHLVRSESHSRDHGLHISNLQIACLFLLPMKYMLQLGLIANAERTYKRFPSRALLLKVHILSYVWSVDSCQMGDPETKLLLSALAHMNSDAEECPAGVHTMRAVEIKI